MQKIDDWFDSPLGISVKNTEQAILDQLLSGYFGYHLMQMSVQSEGLYDASPIGHKFSLASPSKLTQNCSGTFVSEDSQLPLEDDSIDVILLHHLLDFSSSPQMLLSEVARVALPMGQVVIVGFNPLSSWGVWKSFAKLRGHAPWNGNFIRPGRLMDWLNLLNFKVDRTHYSTYGLPLQSKRATSTPDYSQGLSRSLSLPFGSVYIMVARKQKSTMIPIKPTWSKQKAFGQLRVVRPSRPAAGRDLSTRNLPPRD